MAPNEIYLHNQVQKNNKTFKEYVQIWREMTAQVQPPLSEQELVDMFMNSLHGPFHYFVFIKEILPSYCIFIKEFFSFFLNNDGVTVIP